MPHFYNQKEHYFISTNFKVMYTTLKRHKQLKKVSLIRLILSKRDKYVIVRDPYERLESFFKDRLRKRLITENEWLRSQIIFFKPLGISTKSEEEKYNTIITLPFDQFIKLLPVVYKKNRHLHPQYWLFKQFKPKRVLKMKNPGDMQFLIDKLHLDLNIKANSTDANKSEIHWNDDLYKIVNKIYHKDFELFGFSKK